MNPSGATLEEMLQNALDEKARRLAKNREHVRSCRARKKNKKMRALSSLSQETDGSYSSETCYVEAGDTSSTQKSSVSVEKMLQNAMDEKQRRLEKNREHVRSCRARKKMMVDGLQDTIHSLREENQTLKKKNQFLMDKVDEIEKALTVFKPSEKPPAQKLQETSLLHSNLSNSRIVPPSLSPAISNNERTIQSIKTLLEHSNSAKYEALKLLEKIRKDSINTSAQFRTQAAYESMGASRNQEVTSNSLRHLSALQNPLFREETQFNNATSLLPALLLASLGK